MILIGLDNEDQLEVAEQLFMLDMDLIFDGYIVRIKIKDYGLDTVISWYIEMRF